MPSRGCDAKERRKDRVWLNPACRHRPALLWLPPPLPLSPGLSWVCAPSCRVSPVPLLSLAGMTRCVSSSTTSRTPRSSRPSASSASAWWLSGEPASRAQNRWTASRLFSAPLLRLLQAAASHRSTPPPSVLSWAATSRVVQPSPPDVAGTAVTMLAVGRGALHGSACACWSLSIFVAGGGIFCGS